MSDSGPTDLQAQLELLTAEYYSYSIIRYAYSVAAAILAYDYILTIDLEISQVWSQRLTGATLLYFMNRYIYPLNICLSMIEAFYPLNNNKCNHLGWAEDSLVTFVGITTTILIFTLRTWAIYLKNWKIAAIVGLVGMSKFVMTIAVFSTVRSFVSTPNLGCGGTASGNFVQFTKATGYLSVAFDTVVFWLTFYKTFRSAVQMRKLGMTNSVTFWILRDGLLYYVGRLLLTVFELITFSVASTPFAVYEFSAIIPNTFGNVMINHMLLNLRHVSNTHTGGGLSEKTIPELAFAQNSIIGNLGAPLINDPDEFIEERTDIIEFAASSDLDIARDA